MRYLILLLFPLLAWADTGTIDINADGTLKFTCTTPNPDNPNCPPPAPPIGNLHGAIHPTLARTSKAQCDTCHAAGAAIVRSDKVICAQFDFVPTGRTLIDPATGVNAVDPVSRAQIVSGGRTAVLKVGDVVQCRTCHYPHATSNASVREANIHTGCTDCHVGVRNDNLKPGIED